MSAHTMWQYDDSLSRVERSDYDAMFENLSATQARCSALLEENRALKGGLNGFIAPNFLVQVQAEHDRACKLHPNIGFNAHAYMTVLAEEVGEVARAILEKDHAHVVEELVQVAAVTMRLANMIQEEMDER